MRRALLVLCTLTFPAHAESPFVVGDSIAKGVALANNYHGGGVVGATPYAVLRQIQHLPPVLPATVILSSGVSNAPGEIGLVPSQIQALRAHGARKIELLGVGWRHDLWPLNKRLGTIAADTHACFLGPLHAGADGVHPRDYHGIANLK